MFYASIPSELGPILLRANDTHLTGLYFTDQRDCPAMGGQAVVRPGSFDPTAGVMAGIPIKKIKVHKRDLCSGDLFAPNAERATPDRAAAAADPQAARGGVLQDGPQPMQAQTPEPALAIFRQAQTEIQQYFAGLRTQFSVPLALEGTEFQKRIWNALLDIPYGHTVSYGDVARAAGFLARYGRSVGTAVGRNPISIIVPCHRVLSSAGALAGYGGGLERKVALLRREGFSLY